MLSFIYRSPKKDEMYLYLSAKDQFDDLDEALMKMFGTPEFVMMVNLAKRNQLARVDIRKVKAELQDKGYYLQMPPLPNPLNENKPDD